MFNRIRYAAHVLSSPQADPYGQPDVRFEAEESVEVNRISRRIGGLVEVFIIGSVIGIVAAPILVHVWPLRTIENVSNATAVVAAIVGILISQFFEKVKTEVVSRLHIGERIAPYFGHKITNAVKVLRS